MRISDWSSDVCSSDLVVSPDKEKEVCCSHRTGFLDSEPAFRLSGVVGAKNPVGLVAPSFLSSSPAKTGRVPKGRQGRSAGLVRPAAAGEDTAKHALTARRHALRSREWRRRRGTTATGKGRAEERSGGKE